MGRQSSHPLRMISEHEAGFTAYCACCGEFQVSFGQLFLRLKQQDIATLTQSLHISKNRNCCKVKTAQGVRHLLKTPHKEILFSFTTAELNQFIDLMEETKLMVDAWGILGLNVK